jgi:hypothetical protein
VSYKGGRVQQKSQGISSEQSEQKVLIKGLAQIADAGQYAQTSLGQQVKTKGSLNYHGTKGSQYKGTHQISFEGQQLQQAQSSSTEVQGQCQCTKGMAIQHKGGAIV